MNINDIINRYDDFLNNSRAHSAIQMLDNEHVLIENCRKISLLNENEIKLSLSRCDIAIIGLDMKARNYSKTGIEISGKIHSISFEERDRRD